MAQAYDVKRIPASKDPNTVEEDRIPDEDQPTVNGYRANGYRVFMVTSPPNPQICLRRPAGWEPPQQPAQEASQKLSQAEESDGERDGDTEEEPEEKEAGA
ncbi:hypothetical protein [Salinibacter altiplanensis]|uniref:hypothetical protein n=1 Tax=Salinibacter altiplanensis TaxID=1803181 RepID=UPI000C9F604E|nr:hypothetical protein [Salinibacter altiplanensis]